MNAIQKTVEWNGIDVVVLKKNMTNIRLTITRDGTLKLSVPSRFSEKQALHFLEGKKAWIEKHLQTRQLAKSENANINGVPYLGKWVEYSIQYQEIGSTIKWNEAGKMNIALKRGCTTEIIPKLLDAFYKIELQKHVMPFLRKWEQTLGVQANTISFRKMTTRWGTCNIIKKRILFNTDLCKHDPTCMEYIVLHELCHLIESGHGKAFKALMDKHMPDWRSIRKKLKENDLIFSSNKILFQ